MKYSNPSNLETMQLPSGGTCDYFRYYQHKICGDTFCNAPFESMRCVIWQPSFVLHGKPLFPGQGFCKPCTEKRIKSYEIDYSPKQTMVEPRKVENVYAFLPPSLTKSDWLQVDESFRRGLDDWVSQPYSFYLHGSSGVGKSMMCAALLKRLADNDYRVKLKYENVSLMLDRIRRAINQPEKCDKLIDDAVDADVLVFDDLGAEAPSRWTLDRLYVILEERLQAGRVTIVTSNYSPSELRSYLLGAKNADAGLVQAVDRILSRLRGEFRLLPELSGVDRRRDSKGVA